MTQSDNSLGVNSGLHSSIEYLPRKVRDALSKVSESAHYPRFAIDDVVDPQEYELLCEEFPDVPVAPSEHFGALAVLPGFTSYPNLSPTWTRFLNTLRSNEVKNQLVVACYPKTIERYPKWIQFMMRSRLQNPDNYEVNIAFNLSVGQRYLPPHSDNSYKVLALVLYFSESSVESMECGTRFYSPKSKAAVRAATKRFNRLADSILIRNLPLKLLPMTSCNIQNNCKDDADCRSAQVWFEDNFREDLVIGFKGNRIAGFIKTQSSYHAVDMRRITPDVPRRTLLINLNLKHSRIARLGQSFRHRILRKST